MHVSAAQRPPRTLSSLQTFPIKFLTPVGWTGVGAYLVFDMFSFPLQNRGALLFFIGAITLYIFSTSMRLKSVRMDDRALYISNYKKEIVVRLSDVAEVTENKWTSIHPVTIYFHSQTEFGSRVVFIPPLRLFGLWSSHPVVDEIRTAVARAQALSFPKRPRAEAEA